MSGFSLVEYIDNMTHGASQQHRWFFKENTLFVISTRERPFILRRHKSNRILFSEDGLKFKSLFMTLVVFHTPFFVYDDIKCYMITISCLRFKFHVQCKAKNYDTPYGDMIVYYWWSLVHLLYLYSIFSTLSRESEYK